MALCRQKVSYHSSIKADSGLVNSRWTNCAIRPKLQFSNFSALEHQMNFSQPDISKSDLRQ